MDPQQRLLLEEGYSALNSCLLSTTSPQSHGLTGVFLGVDKCEWMMARGQDVADR